MIYGRVKRREITNDYRLEGCAFRKCAVCLIEAVPKCHFYDSHFLKSPIELPEFGRASADDPGRRHEIIPSELCTLQVCMRMCVHIYIYIYIYIYSA